MPTNLSTNFDPSDPELGGTLLESGTSRQGEILEINDALLSVGSSSFGRITSSSPTPAGLQGENGSLSRGSTGALSDYDNNYGGRYDSIYFKNDPALANGDTAAYFALSCWYYGHWLVLADPPTTGVTKLKSQSNASCFHRDWNGRFQNENSLSFGSYPKHERDDNRPGQPYFSRIQSLGTDTPGNDEYLQIDHRLWFFCSDKCLVWKFELDGEQRTTGVGMIWLQEPPSDGHYSRNEVPAISARSFRRWNSDKALSPAHDGSGKAQRTQIQDELNQVPNDTDIAGREIIQNQENYVSNPLTAYKGEIPNLKVVRAGAVATWDTMTINGNNWVCFHRDSGRGYLTRYENAK